MTSPNHPISISDALWLKDAKLQSLFRAIEDAGGEARVAGGAVRNALLGEPVTEVDIATNLTPQAVMAACQAAGFPVKPTGIEHGTVMVIVQKTPFEVTTLRNDVETDGRHAKVKFTDDWREDALRRDFTINAMFADAAGNIYDYANGYKDIQTRRVRFVGLPSRRIREDYLRILRFFRFHARYGKGTVDADGLAACKRLRKGIAGLSAERLRQDMLKLLAAPRAVATLKVMAQSAILSQVLPHTDDFRTIERLPANEPLLRLMALAAQPLQLQARFRLSNAEARRIAECVEASVLSPQLRTSEQRRLYYGLTETAWRDAVRLAWAKSRGSLTDENWQALLDVPLNWKKPVFPVNGQHLRSLGLAAGPKLGETLRWLEDMWIAGEFEASRDDLLKMVQT
jgi:poly(A) polymerase